MKKNFYSRTDMLNACTQLSMWGYSYTYHWLWGVVAIKDPYYLNSAPLTINDSWEAGILASQENIWRQEVSEYRARNIITRFLIRLFNYNDLHKKSILLTLDDIITHIVNIRSESDKFKKRSPQWQPNFINNIVQSGSELKKYIYPLGSTFEKLFANIIDYFTVQLAHPNCEDRTEHEINIMRPIYHEAQIRALELFGITCYIGGTYSEKQIKEKFCKIVKTCHSDKGGSDEKFKLINEARELLEKYAVTADDLHSTFKDSCAEIETQAKSDLRELLENFKFKMTHTNVDLTIDEIENEIEITTLEKNRIVAEFMTKRQEAFDEFIFKKSHIINKGYDFNKYSDYDDQPAAEISITSINSMEIEIERYFDRCRSRVTSLGTKYWRESSKTNDEQSSISSSNFAMFNNRSNSIPSQTLATAPAEIPTLR